MENESGKSSMVEKSLQSEKVLVVEAEECSPEDRRSSAAAGPSEPPPAYSSISTLFGIDRLKTLERINVQNKDVTTKHGELVFKLKRDLLKQGGRHGFCFHLYDETDKMAITFYAVRSCCEERMEVILEGVLASVIRIKSILSCSPTYIISDANKNKACQIRAPKFGQRSFVLKLKDMKGRPIGAVTKKWNGLGEELFSDANVLEIDFPVDLDVKYKAAAICFCVLIIQMANVQYQQRR